MRSLLYVLMLPLFFTSCKTIKVTPPPRLNYDIPIRTPNYSTVKINASISQNDVINTIRDQIKNPIINEPPLEVLGTISATEIITTEELIRKVTKLAEPGHWIDISKKTYRTVKKSVSCALSPWKWGTCWKEVTEAIWVTTKVWVEPQAAILEWVVVSSIKELQKVYKTEISIHYPTNLQHVNLSFNGNEFELKTKFKTKLKFDYDQAIIPFGPTLSINSALKGEFESNATVKGKITIIEPGKIKIDIDEDATDFYFDNITPNLPILERGDLDKILFPIFANIIKPKVEKMAEEAITSTFINAIDDNEEKLNFRNEINDFTRSIVQPKKLADDVWININPQKVLAGQIYGANNRIFYTAGLEFVPHINFEPVEPLITANEIPFETRELINNESYLDLQFNFSLDNIGRVIKVELNNYIKEQPSIGKVIKVSDVMLFKTDNDKLAIKVEMQKKRLFGSWTFFANAYITTKMNYNSLKGHFSFEDIGFTLETKNSLVGTILNTIIDDSVVKILEENSTFSIKDNLRIANSAIKDTTMVLDNGVVSLKFKKIEVSSPYITNKNLEVNAKFQGKIDFSYIPDDQKPIYSKLISSSQLMLELNETKSNPELQIEKNIITKENINNLNESLSYNNYGKINFISDKKLDSLMKLEKRELIQRDTIGATIIIEENGVISEKIVQYEDLIGNDEILMSMQAGRINRLRLDQDDYFSIVQNEQKKPKLHKKDTITIQEIKNYIDKNVIVKGTLECLKQFTAPSGEEIKILKIDDCDYDEVNIFVYLGSVDDDIPDKTYLKKEVFIDAIISFESGKPTIKIKNNNRITLKQ